MPELEIIELDAVPREPTLAAQLDGEVAAQRLRLQRNLERLEALLRLRAVVRRKSAILGRPCSPDDLFEDEDEIHRAEAEVLVERITKEGS